MDSKETNGELELKEVTAFDNEGKTKVEEQDETDGVPSLALGTAVARASENGDAKKSDLAATTTNDDVGEFERPAYDTTVSITASTAPLHENGVGGGEAEEEDEENVEYYCGVGPCHPAWLQKLRDARVFTFLLCLFSAVEGALVSGLTAVVLSTIERRYRLTSTQTGALASMIDVAVVISVIFISYLGGRGHKPRWLGIALIIEAIGAFVFSLPQFLFGRYEAGSTSDRDTEFCADGIDFSNDCTSSNKAAYFFFMVGNIIIGIGAAPLYTIGTSYLDEIVNPKYASIHLGVFYMMSIIGPALGFGLGGLFLSVYVDPSIDTHLTPNDPGWVGAWWLCYIIISIICLVISVPFFFYPKLLPNSKEVRQLREKEMALKGHKIVKKPKRGRLEALREFPCELKKIATNPSWLFVTLGLSLASITISGFASFGVKYVENQFGLTTSAASIITGARTIPTAGAGVIVGGLIIYFFKIRGRNLAMMGLITCALAIVSVFGFLLHCPTPQLAGVTTAYPDGTTGISSTNSLVSNCTMSCNCTSSVFDPVCGDDNIVYFSPCLAGCSPNFNGSLEECSCIAQQLSLSLNLSTDPISLVNGTASSGLCDEDCSWKLQLYLVISAFTLFLVFMLEIPNITITIRCVEESQRTLALGLQSSIVRIIGFVPGPLLFGVVFDSTCLFWQRDCGQRGNCWVYDNTTLSVRAVVLAILAMVWYIVFIFLCWLFYPSKKKEQSKGDNEGGEEEEEDDRPALEQSLAYKLYKKCGSFIEEKKARH